MYQPTFLGTGGVRHNVCHIICANSLTTCRLCLFGPLLPLCNSIHHLSWMLMTFITHSIQQYKVTLLLFLTDFIMSKGMMAKRYDYELKYGILFLIQVCTFNSTVSLMFHVLMFHQNNSDICTYAILIFQPDNQFVKLLQ